MSIRAIIVDDEPPARDLIATLLRRERDVEITGLCANGHEAVTLIRATRPDLVFLDVQMPGLDGFGVLEELRDEPLPLVVFVTAHDRHAVRAFTAHALDYLLKPFEYERLGESVQRARERLRAKDGDQSTRLLALLETLRRSPETPDRLAVRENGRVIFLRISEIDWAEAEGNYVRLHVAGKGHSLRETLGELEARLEARGFLRVSRSAIVNLDRIREWQPLFHGDSVVILHDGSRLTVTRSHRERFEAYVQRLNAAPALK